MKNKIILKSQKQHQLIWCLISRLCCSIFLLLSVNSFSQSVGIGATSFTPDPSAMLEVNSTNKGTLVTRMTTLQRDAISSPAESLLIFNTTTKCFEAYVYGAWVTVSCAACPANVTATPSSQTICGSSSTSINLSSNISGATFTWTVIQSGVTGASSSSGSSVAQTLTNSGATVGTATYVITPTANGCSGASSNVVITVNPIPNVTATPSSQTISSGATTSINLSSNVSGTTFAWTVSQSSGITGASSGSGSSIAQTLANSGTTTGTATYTITPTANACSGASTVVVITVNAPQCSCPSGYSYRVPITISNTSGQSLTNFQVLLTVTYNSHMKSDFSDLRFKGGASCTDMDYWVQSYTSSTSATVWVEIPSIPTSGATIYMYYGNSGASSASNGSNTFDFFDDFSGDLSKWTIAAHAGYTTTGITSGEMETHRTTDWNYIMSAVATNTVFVKSNPIIIRFDHRIVGSSPWGGCGNQMKVYLTSLSSTVSRNAETSGTCADLALHPTNKSSYVWKQSSASSSSQTVEIALDGAGQMKITDNGIPGSWTSAPTWSALDASGFNIELISMGSGGGGGNDYCYYDNVRVRKYASAEPTSSFGSEQNCP